MCVSSSAVCWKVRCMVSVVLALCKVCESNTREPADQNRQETPIFQTLHKTPPKILVVVEAGGVWKLADIEGIEAGNFFFRCGATQFVFRADINATRYVLAGSVAICNRQFHFFFCSVAPCVVAAHKSMWRFFCDIFRRVTENPNLISYAKFCVLVRFKEVFHVANFFNFQRRVIAALFDETKIQPVLIPCKQLPIYFENIFTRKHKG